MKMNACLGATALAVALAIAGAASAMELKAAHHLPPTHPIGIGYQTLADEVKENTNGEVTIRIFPGQSLLGAKANSDGVRDGVADIGYVSMTYVPSYHPHGVLLNDLSMIGEDDMAAAFAITELYMLECEPCRAESTKQNQLFLSAYSTAPYVLIGATDLNSPENIKGKSLRAGGSLWDRFADYVGAVGVNISSAEMYESLSRGILDGAMYAVGGLKTHGLADVTEQVVMLNLGAHRAASLYSFNLDSWSALAPEQRAAFFKAVPVALVRTVNEYHKGDEEALAIAKEQDIPILEPDPGLKKLREEFVESDLPQVIENAPEVLGISAEDAEIFVGKYKELYAKYEELVTPIEGDSTKLSDLLYNEVYAKLDPATYGVK